MKGIFTLFFLLTCFYGFSQTAAPSGWYKMLAGNIDRFPVTLHLHKAGNHYLGFYYYNARQQPIYFFGQSLAGTDNIRLASFTGGRPTEEFTISLTSSGAAGFWKKTGDSLSSSFLAVEMKAPVGCTYVYTTGSVKPDQQDVPGALFEAASVWPLGNGPMENFMKEVIRQSFCSGSDKQEEIGEWFLKEKRSFLAGYLDEYNKGTRPGPSVAGAPYNMTVSDRLVFVYQSPRLVTLARINYSYVGGAHSNYGTTYAVVDLMRKKTLALTDILSRFGCEKLEGLLEKSFRERYRLNPQDSLTAGGLFSNHLKPTDNFFVTAKGIGFNYIPYQIAPYALGEITLFIPFKELEDYLLPAFKGLLQ
ncbi:RsiV family protein [Paraflavisolibacter sp. H34]|uniref:RsiV family protein n=1 Tax=Huijunlia imazamoxiresistens TaxID=3127457 RepID=UPI0030179030